MKEVAVGSGVLTLIWAAFCVVLGLTSPSLAGDLYYFHLYFWPLFVVYWLVVGAFYFFEDANRSPISPISGVVLIALALWVLSMQFGFAYDRSYALRATVAEAPFADSHYQQGFKPRFMPYPVALARLPIVQGDTQGATLVNVTYISDPVNGDRWTGIADANSWATTTKGVVVVNEKGQEYTCPLLTNSLKNAHYWNSMTNRIRGEDITFYINAEDAYGDCVNGVARIVVPLQKTRGPKAIRYPAGVAVFDATGMHVYEGQLPADIFGPVYPSSLAQAQRESLTTGYGYWQWVFGSYGYDAPSGVDSPNEGNQSEFNLVGIADQLQYFVSPLTPKGSSQSLVGETVVNANSVTPGTYNTVAFLRYGGTRDGLQTLRDNVKVNHSEIDWASGNKVMEIVPGPKDSYVGYVGQGTVVKFQFIFNADGSTNYTQLGVPNPQPSVPNEVPPLATSTGEADTCATLWAQLQVASNSHDLSLVLQTSSQLLSAGCR